MSDYYRPLREALPPLEIDVRIPNRLTGAIHRVHITARHLLYREFIGLEDLLIGEVQPIADPTGLQAMKAKRVKLKSVVERISNLDPEIYPGGEVSRKEEVEKWIDADENSDAVWASWIVFEQQIDNPRVKSEAENPVDRSGEDAGESQETGPAAQLQPVRGNPANGEGDGGAVFGRHGNGSVSHAGESGVEAEAVAGVPV